MTFGVLPFSRLSEIPCLLNHTRVITNTKGSVCGFALQQYAGWSAQAQQADPGRENKAMHEAGKAGRERPAARLRPRKDKG